MSTTAQTVTKEGNRRQLLMNRNDIETACQIIARVEWKRHFEHDTTGLSEKEQKKFGVISDVHLSEATVNLMQALATRFVHNLVKMSTKSCDNRNSTLMSAGDIATTVSILFDREALGINEKKALFHASKKSDESLYKYLQAGEVDKRTLKQNITVYVEALAKEYHERLVDRFAKQNVPVYKQTREGGKVVLKKTGEMINLRPDTIQAIDGAKIEEGARMEGLVRARIQVQDSLQRWRDAKKVDKSMVRGTLADAYEAALATSRELRKSVDAARKNEAKAIYELLPKAERERREFVHKRLQENRTTTDKPPKAPVDKRTRRQETIKGQNDVIGGDNTRIKKRANPTPKPKKNNDDNPQTTEQSSPSGGDNNDNDESSEVESDDE